VRICSESTVALGQPRLMKPMRCVVGVDVITRTEVKKTVFYLINVYRRWSLVVGLLTNDE